MSQYLSIEIKNGLKQYRYLDMGELVFVGKDQTFLVDIILIDSKLNDGLFFIETATLNGEKTLKQKVELPELAR